MTSHFTPHARRRAVAAATLAAALCALPVVANAQQDDVRIGGVASADSAPVTRDGLVQIVVDADDGLSNDDVKAIGRAAGVELALNSEFADEANLFIGWVAADQVDRTVDRIAHTDGVEAAEVNMQLSAFNFPDDPLYQYQWHFEQIHTADAWKVGTGKGAVVAILDTGVAYADKGTAFKQAQDLSGTPFTKGFDFVDDDTEPLDEHGHGTHVAGTVAQTTNNGFGVAGVAFNASIMPVRVLNKQGMGSTSDIADAIRWAADNGANVINMSLGGPLPSLVMRSAINYAHGKGVTVVAAAGNAGRRMRSYPAAYNNVIAVAATQYDRSTTFYSQWGKFVDIAAPGGNTRVDQNKDGRPDGVLQQTMKPDDPSEHDFALYMGTSMACPHVAAAAAILYGIGITNPDEIEAVLKRTADDAERSRVADYDEHYGAGILDVRAAASGAVGCGGSMRLTFGALFAFLLALAARRRDLLSRTASINKLLMGLGVLLASSGVFVLPMIFGDTGTLGMLSGIFGRPLAELDLSLFGPGFHQNALLASAAIPAGFLLLGLQNRTLRSIGVGLAAGFAGFLCVEAIFLSSDVQWIPGMAGWLDRAWLGANALASLTLGYLALKRY